MISHELDTAHEVIDGRIISFFVDGEEHNYYNDSLGEYKEKAFPPIDDTIMMFIKDTKQKAKAIEDIRKATSIENNPIGKEEK